VRFRPVTRNELQLSQPLGDVNHGDARVLSKVVGRGEPTTTGQ
jgi:hypothetical protein